MKSAFLAFLLILVILGHGAFAIAQDCIQAEQTEIDEVRRAFELDLVDAQSARFQQVCKFQFKEKDTDVVAYCGLLNSKNRMGAYVGYQPFYWRLGTKKGEVASAAMSPGERGTFQIFYCMSCNTPSKGFDSCFKANSRRNRAKN